MASLRIRFLLGKKYRVMGILELIDTHCHIDAEIFNPNYEDIFSRARAVGVSSLIVPGVHQPWWRRLMHICASSTALYPALGMHPIYLDSHRHEHLEELEQYAHNNSVVAIGEIGLDYFYKDADRQTQQELFEAQLEIATAAQLPIILHVRKAHDQVLSTLRRHKFKYGGIAHAFNGSKQQAQQYMQLGFKLGFGGTLTYNRAKRIRAMAQELPLEAIVLETDAPDIPLFGHQGQANLPEYLPEIMEALASLRPEPREKIARQTTDNARALFGLK